MTSRDECPAAIHGTVWAYQRYRCRCDDTRALITELNRRRYQLRPQISGTGRHNRDRTPADTLNIEIALVRVYCGDPAPALNNAERRTVVTILTEAGWPAWRIAVALGLAQRSVVRHRSAARAAAAVAA